MFKKNAKSEAYAKETNQSEAASGDEALFEALTKTKKRKRRKRIRMILFLLVILAVALFMGTRLLQQRVRDQFAASSKEVLSAKAERGTISTVVSGSGMLVNMDTQAVSVPSGVEVTEILVKYGDQVEKGDILATVDMASVRSAMSDLQEQIETLDKEIASAKDETVSSYISAGVSGRLNAQKYAQGEVTVRLERTNRHHCRLSVANPGSAIAKEDLKNIFKRFYQVDKVRSRDGSFGLGLSIAEGIVLTHHGKIWAESSDGINTFYVELPTTTKEISKA